jgi:beta-phosphoglucomutase
MGNRTPQFQAIIFDLDGVVINSEELHTEAKRITLDHFGIRYPESIFTEYKGRTDKSFFSFASCELAGGTVGAIELQDFKWKVYQEIFPRITLIPGAEEFIRASGLKFAHVGLVTSAVERDFEIANRKFGFRNWFDFIISGGDTERHKPHPEPYKKALDTMGLNPVQVVVIEDSPNGVLSAKGAGCFVVGITTNFGIDDLLQSKADQVYKSYNEIAAFLGMPL